MKYYLPGIMRDDTVTISSKDKINFHLLLHSISTTSNFPKKNNVPTKTVSPGAPPINFSPPSLLSEEFPPAPAFQKLRWRWRGVW